MADPSFTAPSLDLLRGFEAAARHLNFTRAADELFITQSAVSRQIKALEERLGVTLFLRQPKSLRLTQQGERLYRAVSSALRQVNEAMEGLSRRAGPSVVTVTSTLGFCALWLVPRLSSFQKSFPEAEVRIAASDRLLNLDDPDNPSPWLSWSHWLETAGVPGLKPAGSLAFNYYDQVVRAALAGQGVALGRSPLVQDLLQDGSLVVPLVTRAATDRGYWVVQAASARGRPDVERFVQWISTEAPAQPLRLALDTVDTVARGSPKPRQRRN